MKRWLPIFLLAAWLPFAVSLWPLPTEQGARQESAAWASLAKEGESARSFLNKEEREEMDNGARWLSDPENILKEWRAAWIGHAVVLLLGLGSVVFVIRRIKGWKVAIVAASSSYLILAYNFPFSRALSWEQWQAWWMMATEYPEWGIGAIYREILFPLIHIVLIAIFVFFIALTLRGPNPPLNRSRADDARSG